MPKAQNAVDARNDRIWFETEPPQKAYGGAADDALKIAGKIPSKDYVRTPSSFLKFREALRHAASGGNISDLDEINDHFGRLSPEGSGYQGPEGKPNTVNLPDIGRVEARPIPEIEQASAPFL